jgi:hypothetical protein
LLNHLSSKCEYLQASSLYNQNNILASLYIKCNKLVIQVSIFYKRGSYFWTSPDNYKITGKRFGDRARAINRYEADDFFLNSSESYYFSRLSQIIFSLRNTVMPNQIHDFSREFTKFHTFSREFTHFHTFSRNLFFTCIWTANKAKNSLSWAFSQKIFRTQNNPC